MKKIYKFLFFIPFFISGCSANVIEDNNIIQKIDSLDMNIFSKQGEKIYSIKSPNSIYDNNELRFELKNTTKQTGMNTRDHYPKKL